MFEVTCTNFADSPREMTSTSGAMVPSVDARRMGRSSVTRTPSPRSFSTATSTVTVHTRLRGTTRDASAFNPSLSPVVTAGAGGSLNATRRSPTAGAGSVAADCCVMEITP